MLRPAEREKVEIALRDVERILRNIGLGGSAEAVIELRTESINWRHEAYATFQAHRLVSRIEAIQQTIQRETKTAPFMYIPRESGKWC